MINAVKVTVPILRFPNIRFTTLHTTRWIVYLSIFVYAYKTRLVIWMFPVENHWLLTIVIITGNRTGQLQLGFALNLITVDFH